MELAESSGPAALQHAISTIREGLMRSDELVNAGLITPAEGCTSLIFVQLILLVDKKTLLEILLLLLFFTFTFITKAYACKQYPVPSWK